MNDTYQAIFFDWDGTAVESRNADVGDIVPRLIRLLAQGRYLVIVSGTTYENIAGGRLHEIIPRSLLGRLYLGLGRGAFNYGFGDDGQPAILGGIMPDRCTRLRIHQLCADIHIRLLAVHGLESDIVFSRYNYCKIDFLVDYDRKGKLFLQAGEIDKVNRLLLKKGWVGGLESLVMFTEDLGRQRGIAVRTTTDAKYLEVGLGTKSDNVDFILKQVLFPLGVQAANCCYWGDEFTSMGGNIRGSDAFMVTETSRTGHFFDVSPERSFLPPEVEYIGGGVASFLDFLDVQSCSRTKEVVL